MELDLRSFLDSPTSSPSSSDADDDAPHRTIDEILNDCDSSSSSPSPSPPSSPSPSLSLSTHTNSIPPKPTLQPHSFSHPKPPELPHRTRVSRPFSSLLHGVRSNAKPGAALAAAAAASRSVPTPHAAAIMSRRKFAVANGGADSNSITASGDDSDLSSRGELGESSEKFDQVSSKIDTQSSESVSALGERFESDAEIATVSKADSDEVDSDSLVVSEEKRDLDEVDHDHEKDVNSAPIDDDDRDFDEKTNHYYHDGGDEGVSVMVASVEQEELVNRGTGSMEDVKNEVNVGDGEDGGGDDDGSSLGDVAELVEEKLEELESRMAAKRAEKKLVSSKKPLEFAEELEKKHASTGLHYEEGAAAQPMRLEGVRRGSTTLGYFDVDSDNAVTRAISSHMFRREQGSAQVVAVHTNYIAVGMTKGLIVVVPSKYSIHHADNTDGKVVS